MPVLVSTSMFEAIDIAQLADVCGGQQIAASEGGGGSDNPLDWPVMPPQPPGPPGTHYPPDYLPPASVPQPAPPPQKKPGQDDEGGLNLRPWLMPSLL